MKAYILRKILYAESKLERKSLWLKCLGKKRDILMKLLMFFFTFFPRFSYNFYSSVYVFFCSIYSRMLYTLNACCWLFQKHIHFSTLDSFFFFFFSNTLVDENRRWKTVYIYIGWIICIFG